MSLFVRESGAPNAATIVFLHGAGAAGWMWAPTAAQLADYHCLVVDLPGHGQSHAAPWLSLADTAAQIAEIIRARASHGVAHVVGLSLGAYLGAQLLSTQPALIDRAVLSGITVLPLPMAGLMNVMGKLMAPLMKTGPVLRANARTMRIPAEHYAEYERGMKELSLRAFQRAGADAAAFRLPANAAAIDRPVLAITAEREHAVIKRSTALLAGALPNGTARLAPGGHGWIAEHPGLFDSTLRAWLSGATLPAELRPLPQSS
ncbi:MAG TPA: alpha/beta fold hydrolase [Herpetosiphonaceae bacterium]|nr:alpha/beta fold hydrolase [Herpetosiphonaceae bacterium]